jgi:hypothetical protein
MSTDFVFAPLELTLLMEPVSNNQLVPLDKHGMVFSVLPFNVQLELNGTEQFVIKLLPSIALPEPIMMDQNVSQTPLLAQLEQFG